MQFVRTAKRAQKGLRIPSELEVDVTKPSQGSFRFIDPSTILLSFESKVGTTQAVLVLQKSVSYTVKQPEQDALSLFVAPPADNEDDEVAAVAPPLNPK